MAFVAGFALEAATVAVVEQSFERGKPGGSGRWPGWTGRCAALKRSEREAVEVVGEMKRPGEGRRGVRPCHSCS